MHPLLFLNGTLNTMQELIHIYYSFIVIHEESTGYKRDFIFVRLLHGYFYISLSHNTVISGEYVVPVNNTD